MPTILWDNNTTTAILTKDDGTTMRLYVGLFFKYEARTSGVRLMRFTMKDSDTRGPIGIEYLPWREEEKRWATPLWSLRGNTRHLITPPVGMIHYGEHIDWNTVELVNDGVCPDFIFEP
jgi:hypothetical protein